MASRTKQADLTATELTRIFKAHFNWKWFSKHSTDPFGAFLEGHQELLEGIMERSLILNKVLIKEALTSFDEHVQSRFCSGLQDEEQQNFLEKQAYAIKQLQMDIRQRSARVGSQGLRQPSWLQALIDKHRKLASKPKDQDGFSTPKKRQHRGFSTPKKRQLLVYGVINSASSKKRSFPVCGLVAGWEWEDQVLKFISWPHWPCP